MEKNFIDVERLIHSKNPKALKRMPKALIRYLKKIVRQEEINTILEENKEVYGYDFCKDIITRFNIQVNVVGKENIPKSGGAIFAVNHPLGGMDAMAIVSEIGKVRKDIKFIVNDLLLSLKNLKDLFVGVNKHGGNTLNSLNSVNQLFSSENAVFIFPAGLVSRKKKGKVQDLEWKKTFITQAKKNNKPIVPVYLDGELSNFFYNLSKIREFFGVKANIEMLYLANEMFKQKNKTINIVVGKSISPEVFTNDKSDRNWANSVKEEVYKLKKEIN